MNKRAARLALVVSFIALSQALAAERYFMAPVSELVVTEGALPDQTDGASAGAWRKQEAVNAYVVLDDRDAEAYLSSGWDSPQHLLVRTPGEGPVTGTLFMPTADLGGMTRARFETPGQVKTIEERDFYGAKLKHYQDLLRRGVAGAAWFRHQVEQARVKMGLTSEELQRLQFGGMEPEDELSNTYALFSGGRAVSENLQLDRVLPPSTQPDVADVDVASIEGITVQEMDWTPLIEGKTPPLDPLASVIPADQHALFFPNLPSARAILDEVERRGSLLLIASAVAESRSEDVQTRLRYETQLWLTLEQLEAIFGDGNIRGIAVTGSDPYVRVGTDIALLIDAADPSALAAAMSDRLARVRLAEGTRPVNGEVAGIRYGGIVSDDRSISSYWATVGNAAVVTNSLAQLQQIARAHNAETPALASAPEYRFFRDRYPRGDAEETALLILTDATIRRWCGPKWRIADSRRTRAMALMSDLQAKHADAIVAQDGQMPIVESTLAVPELGELRITPAGGVTSSTYGSLGFMTPIAELTVDKVTQAEADSYARWRDTYQQNWRQFFDPIAAKLTAADGRLAADVTVMPLIAGTDYRELISLSQGASLDPASGDPHDEAIAHLAIALNPQSRQMQEFGQMMQGMVALRVNPLAWVGKSVALYADEDPYWDAMARTAKETGGSFSIDTLHRLPVGLHVEVADAMRLAAFLTGIHALADQSAPGMLLWEKLPYGERAYVKVSPAEGVDLGQPDQFAIYYAATPKALVLTLNEDLLKRAIDRQVASTQPATAPERTAWLGSNVALRLDRSLLSRIAMASEPQALTEAQIAAWSNIPILNEWKRRYPDRDPVDVHQQLWKTALVDPAGGSYTWNEQWQTMQSAHYGHPGEQKIGPSLTLLLEQLSAEFGLTFEENGLRAKAELQLAPPR